MNKARLRQLEVKAGDRLFMSSGAPVVWRMEDGLVAIQESPFILDRLRSLGREITYSPYVFPAVLIEPTDSEVIDRIEDSSLYLKGLGAPIPALPALIWADEIDHNKG